MVLVGIVASSLIVVLALRRWFGPLPWSVAAIALALTLGFLHGAVFTKKIPLPLDEVTRGYPYRGFFGSAESRNPLTNDTVKQILPWMQIVREELDHGRLPLWNRYQFSGYPLLANGQSAPFAPMFLATLFVPLPQQIVAMAGLKIFLALIFCWLFLREEGVSPAAGLFGAAVFAFSVFQTVYLYYPMTSVTSLLPAAAFALVGSLRDGSRRWLVLLALVTAGVASGGHPESALHIGIAAVVLVLIERRNPSRALAAALVGLAVSAPAWVPVIQQALLSARVSLLAATPHAVMDHMAAWTLLNPDGFGNPAHGNWQWIYNYSMVAPTYVGLLPLALLFTARRRRDFALLGASAILFLAAMNWTLVGRAIDSVPPMSLVAQDRLRFVVVFFVAVIAARAVDRLSPVALTATASPVALLVSSGVVFGAASWLLYAKWGITLGWASTGGVLSIVIFWLIVWLLGRPRRHLAPAAALVAVVVELFLFNTGFNVLTNRDDYRPSLPILDRLRALSTGETSRIVGHDWTLLPNAAAQYGFEDIRGTDPMELASYARFFDKLAADDPSSDVKRVQNVDNPALAFLGVRFLLTDPSFQASDQWLLRYEGRDGKLFEAKRWMRRFFAPHGDALIGAISVVSPTNMRVEIDSPGRAFIASSQVWSPGWTLVSRGADGSVERLSTVRLHNTFLGFWVPPGHHSISLRYRPWSFFGSVGLALLGLLVGALGLWQIRDHPLHGRLTAMESGDRPPEAPPRESETPAQPPKEPAAKPPRRSRPFRLLLWVVFLLIAAFLSGYIPEALQARRLSRDLRQTELELRLANLQRELGMASHEAQRNNFSAAADAARVFFDGCRSTASSGLLADRPRTQTALAAYGSYSDEILVQLSSADPAVKARLASLYLAMNGVLDRRE